MDEKHETDALSGSERFEARRKAEERLAAVKAQNVKALEDYARLRQIEIAKTARLRAQRLAKEAAEKTAAGRVPDAAPRGPEISTAAKRTRPRKSPQPATPNATNPKGSGAQREQGEI
jgi:hypothetical protein